MAGKFNQKDAEVLLVACHRCCCVCHRYCGVKIELDHMMPGYDGGEDSIENAIPVCFECHAEIHMYNTQHPRGRQFRLTELRAHKEQWRAICAKGGRPQRGWRRVRRSDQSKRW
jgi:L-lactate utilization protein LutB